MITLRGRTLVIPNTERVIGTDVDSSVEVRHFLIPKISPGGIDISHLVFRIDLYYQTDMYDTDLLEKQEQDDHILLIWNIKGSVMKSSGTVFISLRGMDQNGTVRWGTDRAPCYIAQNINTPGHTTGLSELEQYEVLIEKALEKCDLVVEDSKKVTEKAEQTIKESQKTLKSANESADQAEKKAREAGGHADKAEAWTHGRDDFPETGMDNSKYWSQMSADQARKAQEEAERAKVYAGIREPKFWLDVANATLYTLKSTGVLFALDDGRIYWKVEGGIIGDVS